MDFNPISSGYTQAQAVKVGGIQSLMAQLAKAAARVDEVATGLASVSEQIHGPRPEEATQAGTDSAPRSDSISTRLDGLMTSISRLESRFHNIVR